MGYRFLDHTADIGIEVYGANLEDLFSQAACALIELLTDRNVLNGEAERMIHVAGTDLDDLWVNYLREVLYLFQGDNFLVKDVLQEKGSLRTVIIAESQDKGAGPGLDAHFSGEIYNPRRHVIKTEIKAVTYHKASVRRTPGGWRGVFIVDV